MNLELLSFPSSLVGGRPRPRRLFTDPFSSHVPSWGDVPEADSEAVLMAPLRRLRSCFFDDGSRSGIREGDQANMRSKYAIHPSVGMRSPTELERASDGGAGEVAVYEAYLEAGFRGVIPSLIGEVSSFFGTVLCLSRQGYYRYLFGFHILPLRSWPLSSFYAVFYFCRKSLTGLEGAGVVPLLQGLARIGGVWRPDPARACSPHLDALIGSFLFGVSFPVVFSARRRTQSTCWKVLVLTFLLYVLATSCR
ncbi:hypothetical protein F2Q69_00052723 [Brassica cretica]|uniref:Uncharacterized protein n=1 Tax=Brassica cretica TaxID=69181 RepID=A0A8S9MQV7_BRACR|nr:hypothetical protein F2Q69_00052723 [Brassica cretica]